MKTAELERVRRATSVRTNEHIDERIAKVIAAYADATREELTARIDELEQAWDIERTLETHAAAVSLVGFGLAFGRDRRWLALPIAVAGFLFLHGTRGWCPPLPALRKLGVRTRGEIDRERFALKFLRGDFDNVRRGDQVRIRRLVAAVEA